jgi:hypothetical protein
MLIGASGPVVPEVGIPGEHRMYSDEVVVRFDPGAHRYLVQDIVVSPEWMSVPSVTTVLAVIDKSKALVPWATKCSQDRFLEMVVPGRSYTEQEIQTIGCALQGASQKELERAGEIGSATHAWIERYLAARSTKQGWPLPPTDPQVRMRAKAARDWIKQSDIKPFGVERILYSRRNRVIGTTDLTTALTIQERTAVCDFKTSRSLHRTYELQLAAYRSMWAEMTGVWLDDRILIHLRPDGTAEPKVLPAEEAERDAELFFSLAESYRLLKMAGFEV